MAKNDIIKLSDIIPLENYFDYKVHCAVKNPHGGKEPLQDFVDDDWHKWNRYKAQRSNFNRKYIFSMMRFYHEHGTWLFGGIYEVVGENETGYIVELCEHASEYIGRVKIRFHNASRQVSRKLEHIYDQMEVVQILRESYVGTTFRGYENIDLTFDQLKSIIKNQPEDWHGALKNAKGIYLIMDRKTGKGYVGSAYGEHGIWSRWSNYVNGTGDGGNKLLAELLAKARHDNDPDYASNHFKYTLLEYCPKNMDDDSIIERENYWKQVFLTRGFGYNAN